MGEFVFLVTAEEISCRDRTATQLPLRHLILLTPILRFINVKVIQIVITPTAIAVLAYMNAYVEKPTLRLMFGKLKDINQIITIVSTIRLFVTLVR
jgi:hypothetical protein